MSTPEKGNIILADPAKLMRDNPAALIVNRESYDRMAGGGFDPGLVLFPIVTRVYSFSPSGEPVIKNLLTDGNTRNKFMYDQKALGHLTFEDYAKAHSLDLDQYPKEYRSFRFDVIEVLDATPSYLRNRSIVPDSDRQPGQTALTMIQYLLAVIPPTVEHVQIAPDRIAAHLINGWENMVGPEIANRFSALAALSLLSGKVPIATERLLKQYLARQNRLVADEIQEERAKLEKHLLEMGSVIRESKIITGNVRIAQAAFALVSAGSEIIGGEQEARKQVYGMLYTPQVDQKLEEYSQEERTRRRLKLGELVYTALNKAGKDRSGVEQMKTAIEDVLRDQRLDYSTTERVLVSANIAGEYTKAQQEINARDLGNHYLRAVRRDELTQVETVLVERLGGKKYLQDSEIPGLCKAIQEAAAVVGQTDVLISELEAQRAQFLDKGAKAATIDEVVTNLSAVQSALLETDSRQILNNRSNDAKGAIVASQGKIGREIKLHAIGNIVDEVFAEARLDIVYYIDREKIVQEAQVRHAAEQLKSLDLDLQARVLNGEIRLARALQQHDERRKALIRTATEARPTTTPSAPVKTTTPFEAKPISHPVEEDKKAAEERRISINSEKLRQGVVNLRGILKDIDLGRNEIPKEVLEECYSTLNEFGRLIFEHPNIVRAMLDYPQILGQLQSLREARHHKEQVDLSKEAQTKS